MVRHDAEIAADVGDDSADRAAANLGGDLLGRGQADPRVNAGGGGVGGSGGGGSGARRWVVGGNAWRRGVGVQTGSCAGGPGFECLGTEEAAGDAREDQRDFAGTELLPRERVVKIVEPEVRTVNQHTFIHGDCQRLPST